MDCIKCKKRIDDDSVYCKYCGKKQHTTTGHKKGKRPNGSGSVYKRGDTWTVAVTVGIDSDGHQRRITKGGFATKKEALAYCPVLAENPMIPKNKDTFAAMYDRWAAFYAPRVKPETMDGYKSAFGHFKPVHHRIMHELSLVELQSCIDACKRGRSTRNNMKTVCTLVYKFALQNGIVTKNHAEYLFTGHDKKGTHDAFTADELQRIARAVGIHPYADYVYCMIYTGFRPGEMLALKKSSYDPEHACLVGGGKTKAGTDRIVPVSPKIQGILSRLLASPSDYLFPSPAGGRMTDEHFRRCCFEPLMSTLGITGKVPYSCRHTFANLLKNVSGSDTDKAHIIGHADASMTKYYQSADYDSMRAIIDAL